MSLPYFPMFPTDFEAKTSHLTLEEDGAYNRLLRLMWMTPGCSLPDDDAWIMRRMRVDAGTYERVVLVVIDEFCDRENGRVSNAKLMRVFEESSESHKRRVLAGSKGGKNKALKNNEKSPSNAKAKPRQPEPEPEPDIKSTDVDLSARPICDASEAIAVYNAAASRAGWPQVQKMTDARRRAVRARLAECGGVDGWRLALEKAEASDFLCGRTSKPWHGFGFDWLSAPRNFTKLMEGNYDNRSGKTDPADDPTLRAIARAAGAF